MIGPVGTRIGVRHTTGEWIPAVVTGEHWTGATIVRTVPDPLYVAQQLKAGAAAVNGVPLAIPLEPIRSGLEKSDYWQYANDCVFRRKCEDCKGHGSTIVEQAPTLATLLANETHGQELTCASCGGKGWQRYDPWQPVPGAASDSSGTPAAAAPTAPHGDSSV